MHYLLRDFGLPVAIAILLLSWPPVCLRSNLHANSGGILCARAGKKTAGPSIFDPFGAGEHVNYLFFFWSHALIVQKTLPERSLTFKQSRWNGFFLFRTCSPRCFLAAVNRFEPGSFCERCRHYPSEIKFGSVNLCERICTFQYVGFNKSYRLDMGSSKRSGQHFFLFMYIVSIVFWVSNSNENRRKIHVNPPDYHTHFGRELRPEQLPKKTGHKLQLKQRLTRSRRPCPIQMWSHSSFPPEDLAEIPPGLLEQKVVFVDQVVERSKLGTGQGIPAGYVYSDR